jgi:hypothetical protein
MTTAVTARYRAIAHNYDLLRWAVEDTHTQRHCGDEGEGEIMCHCYDSDEAEVIARALNASDAGLRARVQSVIAWLNDTDAYRELCDGTISPDAVLEKLRATLKV